MPPVHSFVRKLSQLFWKLLQEGLLVSFKSPTSNMCIQNHEYTTVRLYNKVILYRFLKQLDLLLLNKGIKRKFWHFLCLTISYILNALSKMGNITKCTHISAVCLLELSLKVKDLFRASLQRHDRTKIKCSY